MRDYSKVSSQFWTGKTGKMLRGDPQAQIVALYLMTSPHANMIGVFNCPPVYIAHETGSPLEGALEGLQRLSEGGFCTYDEDTEIIWVHEMAKFQIGCSLKDNDNRVKDIQKQYECLPKGKIRRGFYEKYGVAYCLTNVDNDGNSNKPLASPLEAPPKPETETGAEAGAGAEENPPPPPSKIKFLDAVYLTEIERQKLQEAIGQKNLEIGIEQLDYSITVKGGKYTDHYKTLLNWNKRGFLVGGGNGNENKGERVVNL